MKAKKEVKEVIVDILIKIGSHAVGKCIIPGMFDPKIPDELKNKPNKEMNV